MTTDVLQLPEIAEAQASKYVTHNEALRQLEAMFTRALSRTNGGPPASPAAGAVYIVDSATGDWSTANVDDLAHFYGGAWHFYPPVVGLSLTVLNEGTDGIRIRYTTAGWREDVATPRFPVVSVSSSQTLTAAHRGRLILVDTSAGAVTITLPAMGTAKHGYPVAIVKATDDANTVTIAPDGTDTIGWDASKELAARGDGTLIVSDGVSNWVGVGGGGGADLPLLDSSALFADADDETRLLAYNLGLITTGTTRTATWPDKDGTVAMLSDITGGGIASDEFDEDAGTTTGLTWGYQAGSVRVGEVITDYAANTVTLTDEATNYVEIDPVGTAVTVNQSGFTPGRIPIRQVTTTGGAIDTSTDMRAWIVGRVVFYSGLTEELPANDEKISRPEIQDYGETTSFPVSSAGAVTIDLEQGNVSELELTEATTVSFGNPPASGITGSLTLILMQDATGGWSVTWPASVAWAGGTAPTLSTAAGAVDVLTFVTTDGGTTWYGFAAGLDMQ